MKLFIINRFLFFLCILIFFCSCNNYVKVVKIPAVEILKREPDKVVKIFPLNDTIEKGISFPSICKNTFTGKYFMYYGAWTDDESVPFVSCVAVSEDGINWVRPMLSIHKWNGGGGVILYQLNMKILQFRL